MSKKQRLKDLLTPCQGATLREANIGRNRIGASTILKLKHLQKLAIWASSDSRVPPLSAIFGYRLAANAEAAGVPLDPSLFSCERCESILQPGDNCTIRIVHNAAKAKNYKRLCVTTQNNTVWMCHFCSHCNLVKGTPKDHVKGLLISRSKSGNVRNVSAARGRKTALKPESFSESNSLRSRKFIIESGKPNDGSRKQRKSFCSLKAFAEGDEHRSTHRMTEKLDLPAGETDTMFSKKRVVSTLGSNVLPAGGTCYSTTDLGKSIDALNKSRKSSSGMKGIAKSLVTPEKMSIKSSKKKRKKSVLGSDKQPIRENCSIDSGKNVSGSSKRKRKSWSSLNEIAENHERQKVLCISNIAIPFPMTSPPDPPSAKQTQRHHKKQLLDKKSTQDDIDMPRHHVNSSGMNGGARRKKGRKGESIENVVTSVYDKPPEFVQETNVMRCSHHGNVVSKNVKKRCRDKKLLGKQANHKEFAKSKKHVSSKIPAEETESLVARNHDKSENSIQETNKMSCSGHGNLVRKSSLALPIKNAKKRCPDKQLLEKKSKKEIPKSKKQISSEVSGETDQNSCKEEQGAHASVASTSDEQKSSVQQTGVTHDAHHVNMIWPTDCQAARTDSDCSLGSNVTYLQQFPLAMGVHQFHHWKPASNMSNTLQSPTFMANHQPGSLCQGFNWPTMQQTVTVMTTHQLPFFVQGSSVAGVDQSPVIMAPHCSQQGAGVSPLQQYLFTGAHLINHLSQESSFNQPSVPMADPQFCCLNNEATMVAQQRPFPHYNGVTGNFYQPGQDGASASGASQLGQFFMA